MSTKKARLPVGRHVFVWVIRTIFFFIIALDCYGAVKGDGFCFILIFWLIWIVGWVEKEIVKTDAILRGEIEDDL